MELYGVRRLLVMDPDKRLVGIITLDDLAIIPGQRARAGQVLGHVSPAGSDSRTNNESGTVDGPVDHAPSAEAHQHDAKISPSN